MTVMGCIKKEPVLEHQEPLRQNRTLLPTLLQSLSHATSTESAENSFVLSQI